MPTTIDDLLGESSGGTTIDDLLAQSSPKEIDYDKALSEKTEEYKKNGILSSLIKDQGWGTIPGVLEQIPAGLQAIGGVGSGLASYVGSGLDPEAYQKGKQWFAQTPVSKVLTPETQAGQGIAAAIGAGLENMTDSMKDPAFVKRMVGNVPLVGGMLENSPEVQGVVSGFGTALPDILAVEGAKSSLSAVRDAAGNLRRGAPETAPRIEPTLSKGTTIDDLLGSDPGLTMAKFKQADAEQVARLEAEMARRNQPFDETLIAQHETPFNPNPTVMGPRQAEGFATSEQGITSNEVPPGGVVPRDAQFFNGERDKPMLTVPRDGEWVKDENGMPVRQEMPESTVAPEYINRYMRQDEAARNDLGNAIQEANGPKLGDTDFWGTEPLSKDEWGNSPSLLENSRPTLGRGFGNKQRGAVDFNEAADLIKKGWDAVGKQFDSLSKVNIKNFTTQDKTDYLKSVPGLGNAVKDSIIKPPLAENLVPKILAEGKDGPPLIKSIQSGLSMTAEKTGSGLMRGVADWLNWADKRTSLDYRNNFHPVEKAVQSLRNEMPKLADVMKDEMFNEKRFNPEELKAKGLSPKAIDAYAKLRDAQDRMADYYDKGRSLLGQEPLKRGEAYLASTRNGGNYHVVINGIAKDGSRYPAWHSTFHSVRDAYKAVNYFKENFKDNSNIDIAALDKFTPDSPLYHWTNDNGMYRQSNRATQVPRDIIGAYHDIAKLIDPESDAAKAITDAINKANENAGYNVGTTKQRFMDKANIRGFEGDMPWLSPKENAIRLFNSQFNTLREGLHWVNTQEALSNIKELMSNPDIIKQQPRNMAMVKEVMNQHLGLSKSLMKDMEEFLAHNLFGADRGTVREITNTMKGATYLTQLSASVGYMIATPLTALNSVGAALREVGLGALKPTTAAKAIIDGVSGFMGDMSHEFGKGKLAPPMTEVGKLALKYAEENGVVNRTVFSPGIEKTNVHYANNAALGMAGKGLETVFKGTMSIPEKMSRLFPFMAFVHHLNETGKFTDINALFKRAEELTNNTQVNFRSHEKPTFVNKLGSMGSLSYMYKAPIFNFYHQLATYSRELVNGPSASIRKKGGMGLAGLVGATAFLGGALALPLINEMDGLYNWAKDIQAEVSPDKYEPGLGLKGTIIAKMPTISAYGAVSDAMGAQMSSRFSPNAVDMEHPFSQMAAVTQELSEQEAVAKYASNPNTRNALSAAYVNAPRLIQGQMQRWIPEFKGGKQNGGTVYLNPRDLEQNRGTVIRNPREERMNSVGLRDIGEAKRKDLEYIINNESKRVKTAYDNNIDRAFSAILDKNSADSRKYVAGALRLIPDEQALTKALNSKIESYNLSPEQRMVVHANTIEEIQKVKRLMDAMNANK